MKCRSCGAAMKARRENYHYTACGLPHVVLRGVEVRRCSSCGAHALALPRVEDLHRLIARSLAKKRARLEAAEIRFLRKHLGLSGKDFAARMGVSAGTVSRWESEAAAQPMGAVAERLLRLMALSQTQVGAQPTKLDVLDHVAELRPAPLRLDLRANSKGWEAAREAA